MHPEANPQTTISGANFFQHAIFPLLTGGMTARFFIYPAEERCGIFDRNPARTCGTKVLRLLYNCHHEIPNITLHCPLHYEHHH